MPSILGLGGPPPAREPQLIAPFAGGEQPTQSFEDLLNVRAAAQQAVRAQTFGFDQLGLMDLRRAPGDLSKPSPKPGAKIDPGGEQASSTVSSGISANMFIPGAQFGSAPDATPGADSKGGQQTAPAAAQPQATLVGSRLAMAAPAKAPPTSQPQLQPQLQPRSALSNPLEVHTADAANRTPSGTADGAKAGDLPVNRPGPTIFMVSSVDLVLGAMRQAVLSERPTPRPAPAQEAAADKAPAALKTVAVQRALAAKAGIEVANLTLAEQGGVLKVSIVLPAASAADQGRLRLLVSQVAAEFGFSVGDVSVNGAVVGGPSRIQGVSNGRFVG